MDNEKGVRRIKELIRSIIPYKKEIIFFGSRATDEGNQNSDYDLLVIVHNETVTRKNLVRLQAKIKRLCAREGLDADVIVRDYTHAEDMKRFPGNIIHSALQTGVYL